MADNNLPLKLLVAGIIGAVIGAAATEKYHLPTGSVYGPFNKGPGEGRPAIDPMIGSGRAELRPDDGPWAARPDWPPPPDYWPPLPPPRYREPAVKAPAPRAAWCYRDFEEWNFGTTRYWVRCPPGRRREDG
jgi:hypothetical protein